MGQVGVVVGRDLGRAQLVVTDGVEGEVDSGHGRRGRVADAQVRRSGGEVLDAGEEPAQARRDRGRAARGQVQGVAADEVGHGRVGVARGQGGQCQGELAAVAHLPGGREPIARGRREAIGERVVRERELGARRHVDRADLVVLEQVAAPGVDHRRAVARDVGVGRAAAGLGDAAQAGAVRRHAPDRRARAGHRARPARRRRATTAATQGQPAARVALDPHLALEDHPEARRVQARPAVEDRVEGQLGLVRAVGVDDEDLRIAVAARHEGDQGTIPAEVRLAVEGRVVGQLREPRAVAGDDVDLPVAVRVAGEDDLGARVVHPRARLGAAGEGDLGQPRAVGAHLPDLVGAALPGEEEDHPAVGRDVHGALVEAVAGQLREPRAARAHDPGLARARAAALDEGDLRPVARDLGLLLVAAVGVAEERHGAAGAEAAHVQVGQGQGDRRPAEVVAAREDPAPVDAAREGRVEHARLDPEDLAARAVDEDRPQVGRVGRAGDLQLPGRARRAVQGDDHRPRLPGVGPLVQGRRGDARQLAGLARADLELERRPGSGDQALGPQGEQVPVLVQHGLDPAPEHGHAVDALLGLPHEQAPGARGVALVQVVRAHPQERRRLAQDAPGAGLELVLGQALCADASAAQDLGQATGLALEARSQGAGEGALEARPVGRGRAPLAQGRGADEE